MTEDGANFDGRHYRLRGATLLPRPAQQPHPPVWIGAGGPRMLGIVARYADVWHTFGSPEHLDRLGRMLDDKLDAAGRSPADVLRSTSLSIEGSWDEVQRQVDGLDAIGIGYLVVGW